MERLLPIKKFSDIPSIYQNTPIGLLLEYHNLGKPYGIYPEAELLIGMCMDNRKHLHMPDNFAFIIRSGGANLRYSEFKVSFAIAIGGVKHIVLIAHNQCGMVNVLGQKELFVKQLVENAGWNKKEAEEHFDAFAPTFEIGNELDFVLSEAKRLRTRYPKIMIAPMYYRIEDNQLYLMKE